MTEGIGCMYCIVFVERIESLLFWRRMFFSRSRRIHFILQHLEETRAATNKKSGCLMPQYRDIEHLKNNLPDAVPNFFFFPSSLSQ